MLPVQIVRALVAASLLVAFPAGPARAEDPAPAAAPRKLLVRGNLGIDVVGGGVGGGAGIGYRLPGGGEIVVDLFYSPYSETYTEGVWDYDYEESLTVLAVRYDLLTAGRAAGIFPVFGTGLFVAGLSWEERSTSQFTGQVISDDDDVTASGMILNLGLGYALGPAVEARLEAPIMIFFGREGRASAIAIPLSASLGFRF